MENASDIRLDGTSKHPRVLRRPSLVMGRDWSYWAAAYATSLTLDLRSLHALSEHFSRRRTQRQNAWQEFEEQIEAAEQDFEVWAGLADEERQQVQMVLDTYFVLVLDAREAFDPSEGDDRSCVGLALTRAIIEQHGGRFEVASIPDEGAHARISLPLRD